MGTSPPFSAKFSKGDNFYDFAYLKDEVFPKWCLLLKERICSNGSKLFHEMTSNHMGGNNENDRVASPESVPM